MPSDRFSSIHSRLCAGIFSLLIIFSLALFVSLNVNVNSSLSPRLTLHQNFTRSNRSETSTSYLCDHRNIDRLTPSNTIPTNQTFDNHRRQNLVPYCDIVPIPRRNWTKAKTYLESDVVFVIFTAASFYHTRATATRDTWLSRVTNYYFLSATPYPPLPVTVIENAGEDKLSNMKKLFHGLDRIYHDQMKLAVDRRQKWFYIIGCDTFVLPHHLLKRLDGLDHRQSLLVGGHSGRHACLGRNRSTGVIEFPSGGAGFFFSMKLLEVMQPHLIDYVENVWPKTSEISDVALTCLAKELGVGLTKQAGFWSHPPRSIPQIDSREQFHAEPEPNNYHYVQPDEMYALDEFYVHQHMDRLINDQNWQELIEFNRRFVISHYDVLRKKRKERTILLS